jgi:hypothetical protein
MPLTEAVKAALKRGALVTAANWEVVVIQFVAESAFKTLLVVPVVGAAFLVTLIVGSSVEEILTGDLRQTVALAVAALGEHSTALVSYLAGVCAVVVGGSVLMFVVKAGSVAVLIGAERAAPPVEHPPLRVQTVRLAEAFSLEAFAEGSARFRGRFIGLGLVLLVVYGLTGAAYLGAVVLTYRWTTVTGAWAGTLLAALASAVLVAWLTVVNLLYLLIQLMVAARDTGVGAAVAALPAFLSGERRLVSGVFVTVVLLVLLATAASILATAALGFVGFVPVFGLAMLPLQFLAWLGRGLLFEFLGLGAVTTYAYVLRRHELTGTGEAARQ